MNKVVLLLIVAGAVGAVAFFGIRSVIRTRILAPFRPNLDAYLAGATPPSLDENKFPAPVVFHGKLIVVEEGKHDFDDLFFDLPDSLAASRPEDVGAVVSLKRGSEMVGTYSGGGGPAYVQTCHVSVIDKDTHVVLFTRDFRGGYPPSSKKSNESGMGSLPDPDIVIYLKTLH